MSKNTDWREIQESIKKSEAEIQKSLVGWMHKQNPDQKLFFDAAIIFKPYYDVAHLIPAPGCSYEDLKEFHRVWNAFCYNELLLNRLPTRHEVISMWPSALKTYSKELWAPYKQRALHVLSHVGSSLILEHC